MTIDDLLLLHQATCDCARDIMRKKNHDYTSGSADPFANFRASAVLGVHPVIGILARSIDKFQRIRSFVEQGALAVKTESVDDAIQDVVNYMILAQGMLVEMRQASAVKEQ